MTANASTMRMTNYAKMSSAETLFARVISRVTTM